MFVGASSSLEGGNVLGGGSNVGVSRVVDDGSGYGTGAIQNQEGFDGDHNASKI